MSTDRDTTRIVRSWLRTDENDSADGVLAAVLGQLDTTPQRRAIPARRSMHMSRILRFGAVAAVVSMAVLVGYVLLVGQLRIGPEPSPSATVASLHPRSQAAIGSPYPMPDAFATRSITLDAGLVTTSLEVELPIDGSVVFGPDEDREWLYAVSDTGSASYIGTWGLVIADVTGATNHRGRWQQDALGVQDPPDFMSSLAATGSYEVSAQRATEVANRPAVVAEVSGLAPMPAPSGDSVERPHLDVNGVSAILFDGATRAYVVKIGERLILIHFWSTTAEGLELHREIEDRIVSSIRAAGESARDE